MRRRALLLPSCVLLPPGPAAAQAIVRQSGNATVQVDPRLAFPGGLFVVHVTSRRPLGGYLSAVFDGRRIPCFSTRRGQRVMPDAPLSGVA